MRSWLSTTLGEVADIGSSKRIFAADYIETGVPFYRSKEIIEKAHNSPITTGLFIAAEKFEQIKRRFGAPSQGDILLTSVGTLGVPYRVKAETFYFKDGNLIWLRNFRDGVSPEFVYHWFRSHTSKAELLRYAIGVAQPAFTIEGVKKAAIAVPPQAIQLRIAKLLSAYDDLIENNTRRIKILEHMAQMLYREWFVNFRFPGHEMVKMANSEMGLIPEGWQTRPVTQAVDVDPHTKVPRDGLKPFVPMGSLSISSMLINDVEEREGNSGSKFRNRDTLFARITPCLENGKTGFVQFLPSDEAVAFGSTEFIVLRSRTLCPEYVYLMARSNEFRDNAIKSMSGATGRQRVQQQCFDMFYIAQPPSNLFERFQTAVAPMFRIVQNLCVKNANLRSTRDLLLPKLVSGEVSVEQIEEEAFA
jgi:type I restriction enzyme S subunit